MWAVRVSLGHSDLQSEWTRILGACERFVLYEHEADEEINRSHVHCLVVNPSISDETMKNWIGRHRGKGNTFWSFKTTYKPKKTEAEIPVNLNFITYMSKGTYSPLVVKGFTAEEIEQYRVAWVNYPTHSSVKADNDDKKNTITMYHMAREVHESFRYKKNKVPIQTLIDPTEYQDNDPGYTDPAEPYREYIKRAIHVHHKYEKAFCSFSLEKVVQTAFSMRAENRESLVDKMCKKFYD